MNDVAQMNGDAPRAWHRHPAMRFALWVVGGAVAGYGFGWLMAELEGDYPVITTLMGWADVGSLSDVVAMVVAAGLIFGGVAMLVMSRFSDARLRRALDADPDDNPARMRSMMPVAGWGMLIYAAMILTFLIPGIPAPLGIAIVLGGFAIVSWLFWRGTAMMDELEQAAQREALVAAFIIVEALGFSWAILHHYALVPAIEPVLLVAAITLLYFIVGMIAAWRRGLAQ